MNEFLFEDLSTVSSFLKSQYNNIFKDPNDTLNKLFIDFTKKADNDKNPSILYRRFLESNYNIVKTEINNAETIEDVNKILLDEIKYFYFSLKPIANKLQNSEFTIQKIFERSRDKRLITLMSFPEDKFSNSVYQYVSEIVPEIKKAAGMNQENIGEMATTERIRYNIMKILEADEVNADEQLTQYKKAVIDWLDTSVFDMIRKKTPLLNQMGSFSGNIVDQLSKQMKATNNDNAKKMIINHIMNMDKEGLKKLALSMGITEEQLGQL